jgi:hypothetical protein
MDYKQKYLKYKAKYLGLKDLKNKASKLKDYANEKATKLTDSAIKKGSNLLSSVNKKTSEITAIGQNMVYGECKNFDVNNFNKLTRKTIGQTVYVMTKNNNRLLFDFSTRELTASIVANKTINIFNKIFKMNDERLINDGPVVTALIKNIKMKNNNVDLIIDLNQNKLIVPNTNFELQINGNIADILNTYYNSPKVCHKITFN